MRLAERPLRAVLLDRDGTINIGASEGDYVHRTGDVRLLPGAGAALARLTAASIPMAVVTNQRGVALGRMSIEEVDAVNSRIAELLHAQGAHIASWHVCPHERGTCACRKPLDGLLRQALAALSVDPADAVVIGDRESDVEAGVALGLSRILLSPTVPTTTSAHVVVPDLAAAVGVVLGTFDPG